MHAVFPPFRSDARVPLLLSLLFIPLVVLLLGGSSSLLAAGTSVQLPPMAGKHPGILPGQVRASDSVARIWNEAMLESIRLDMARPTVHARNLFGVSAAMYDAWAAYDHTAVGVYTNEKLPRTGNIEAARKLAISYAAFRVLLHRFAASPGQPEIDDLLYATMDALGYNPNVTGIHGNSAAAVGNRIAAAVIMATVNDGSNEADDYADNTGYVPGGKPLVVAFPGTSDPDIAADIDFWQPLIVPGSLRPQGFLTPHWGQVNPFSLTRPAPGAPYLDPEIPPPQVLDDAGQLVDEQLRMDVLELIVFSGQLDPSDGVIINISPSRVGNNLLGKNDGVGHEQNPATGERYPDNEVLRGDWTRVLAEFWADGPRSSTPPGHWNEIANEVSDAIAIKQIGGTGRIIGKLEWDIKLYLALNGALLDTSIATWEVKRKYESARPITLIRGLAEIGQLPLEDGVIELVDDEYYVYAWKGHPADPAAEFSGAGWIRALDWKPYQAKDFVTPPFPGCTSGHSGFSRAAAEILTHFTGSEFFPGGLGEYVAGASSETGFALDFEAGPSEEVRLQWATYYDAADEAGISRIYGGIHLSMDDLPGRIIGHEAAMAALDRVENLFAGTSY